MTSVALQIKTSSVKVKEIVKTVTLSEIRSGRHFFYNVVGDPAAKVVDDSMRLFTTNNGTMGGPCDLRINKVVAALFDDGTGKRWYRAKIIEKKTRGKATVLFVDYGNIAVVPTATHLRPLDTALDVTRIAPIAKEAQLSLIQVRSLDDDDGVDAARMLSSLAWGKKMEVHIHCQIDGKAFVTLTDPTDDSNASVNEQLVSSGLALKAKKVDVDAMMAKMIDSNSIVKLSADISAAQDSARKNRTGMWRYGDIGEEDEE